MFDGEPETVHNWIIPNKDSIANVALYGARVGLYFTSSMLAIPTYESYRNLDDEISVNNKIFTDGIGKISTNLATEVS
jgi:hypothetical protein